MVTERQFLEVCSACKDILRSKNSSIQRIAIPWLHPIREHPIALERYLDLFRNEGMFRKIAKQVIIVIIYNAIWLRQIYRAIVRGSAEVWGSNDDLPNDADVLFISHLVNPDLLSDPDDFYFGPIPSNLSNGKSKVVVAYIHNLGSFEQNIKRKTAKSAFSKLFFSDTLTLKKELRIRRLLRTESGILNYSAKSEENHLRKKIYIRAAKEILSGEAQSSLRLVDQIVSIVKRINPRVIVIPYEGHAYERVSFAAARTVQPCIKCVSYQHTGIFRLSNAIRQTLSSEYNPNIILTAGNETKEELRKISEFDAIEIDVLGSTRGVMGSAKVDIVKNAKKPVCLVMPEGILDECLLLFKFSVECAKLRPDILFIWRLHPSVTFDRVLKLSVEFQTLPQNIVLSGSTLESDIAVSAWVLYRGTTAIFKAISAGLRPFYLNANEELTIDPLYRFDRWRIMVNAPTDLVNCIDRDINLGFAEFQSSMQIAVAACKDRFAELNMHVLDRIVSK